MSQTTPIRNRKRVLLVARESSTGSEAKYLLGQMFTNIVRKFEDFEVSLPDFSNVVDLYENPHKVGARTFRAKGMKAVLIKGEQCDVLLSLASARKLDETGDNAFVEVLCEVLSGGGYAYAVSAAISRLCRNTKLAGKLETVLDAERTVVIANQKIKVWESSGQMLWMLLVWFSAMEAQQIEARMMAGKMARAEQGFWTFGFWPPPGWRLTKDRRVEVDPYAADAIRFLIAEVLSGQDNLRQATRDMLARFPDLPARKGGGLLADSEDPSKHGREWLRPLWHEAYVSEAHRVAYVSHEEKKRRAKAEAEGEKWQPDADSEYWSVLFKLPPQPTPIATEAEIAALRRRLDEISARHGYARRRGSKFGSEMRWSASGITVEVSGLGGNEHESPGRASTDREVA